MLMSNNQIKNYIASGAIAGRRFVKFGASDSLVVQAGATDAATVIGVSDVLTVADAQRVDVYVESFCDVDFGGTVTRGTPVKADASGKAVAAASGDSYCGIAMVSAVSGDIGSIRLARGVAP